MIKKLLKKMIPSYLKKRAKQWALNQVPPQGACNYELNIQHHGRAEGKTCLVTGGTGAIGSAICLRMAVEGAIVGVCGRSLNKIQNVINQIISVYPEAKLIPLVLDVTNDKNIETSIQDFANKTQHLDYLINNAGGG